MSYDLSTFLFTLSEKIKGIIKHEKREKDTKKGKGFTKIIRQLRHLRQLKTVGYNLN